MSGSPTCMQRPPRSHVWALKLHGFVSCMKLEGWRNASMLVHAQCSRMAQALHTHEFRSVLCHAAVLLIHAVQKHKHWQRQDVFPYTILHACTWLAGYAKHAHEIVLLD